MRMGTRGSILPLILLAGLVLLFSASAASAQVACGQLNNQCAQGVCPDLYDGAGTLVGSPTCQQPRGEKCACVYQRVDPACTIDQQSKKCKGRCESLFRSAADARAGKNPVKGTCMQIAGAPAGSQCQCVWKFR